MMHQQINKKIIIYLFIFFMLVTTTNKKLSDDFYKIKDFDIKGLNQIETEKLYRDIKIFKNINIFLFKKSEITNIIQTNKFIEELDIFKIYPSTLKVEIKKSKFLAITKKNGTNFIVMENGKLINTNHTILKLPYIFGDIVVNDFLDLKKMIDISNFEFSEIKNLYYFKSNRWDLMFNNGLILKMPINLTLKKLNLIFEIISKNEFNEVMTLDFRQNNMLIINE